MANIAPLQHTIDPWMDMGIQTIRRYRDFASLVDQVVAQGTRLVFEPLDHAGYYDQAADTIALDVRMQWDGGNVIACMLLHEVIHAISPLAFSDTRMWARVALEEEIRAFSYEAALWERLRWAFLGSTYVTRYQGSLEIVRSFWLGRNLQQYVLLNRGYQEFAFGQALVA